MVSPAFSLAVSVPEHAVPRVKAIVAATPGTAVCQVEDRGDGHTQVTVDADGPSTLAWLQAALPDRLGPDLLGIEDLVFHAATSGKLAQTVRARTATEHDLALLDVDADRRLLAHLASHPRHADRYTGRSRRVALITDGSAVLDFEPMSAEAALPAVESQAALLHRATGLDVIPLPVSVPGAAGLVAAISMLAPGFGATVLVHTRLRHVAAVRATVPATPRPLLDAVNDGLAVAATAAVLNQLRAAGTAPRAARVVLVDPARGGDLAGLLLAAGVRDLTHYDPVAIGVGPLHRIADQIDLIVDLIGLAAPPTSAPVLRVRPEAPPSMAAATTGPRPLHALPGLLVAAVATGHALTPRARLAAARALAGCAAPSAMLPPLHQPDLTSVVAAAAVRALTDGER